MDLRPDPDPEKARNSLRTPGASTAAPSSAPATLTPTWHVKVRLATWDEIDTACRVWTISAARMKAKREHRVPLCRRALDILDAARTLGDGAISCSPCGAGNRSRRRRCPRCSSTIGSRPWRTASVRRSAIGRPRRRTTRARSSRRRWHTWSRTRSKRPMPGRTCSTGDGRSWTIGGRRCETTNIFYINKLRHPCRWLPLELALVRNRMLAARNHGPWTDRDRRPRVPPSESMESPSSSHGSAERNRVTSPSPSSRRSSHCAAVPSPSCRVGCRAGGLFNLAVVYLRSPKTPMTAVTAHDDSSTQAVFERAYAEHLKARQVKAV